MTPRGSTVRHHRGPLPSHVLVGRDLELELLLEFVGARRPTLSALVLLGEAGIGKSTLLAQALRASPGRVLTATADPLTVRRPFGLILDALARPAGLTHPVTVADGSFPDEHDVDLAQHLVESLVSLCEQAPLLLAVDDVHWADEESLVLLQRLGRVLAPMPFRILATARPHRNGPVLSRLLGDLARRGVLTEVTLGPLDDEAVGRLAAPLFGPHPEAEIRRQLATAGGNPLYLHRILASLSPPGAVGEPGSPGDPAEERDGATALEEARPTHASLGELHDLTGEARDVLTTAALLGPRFTVRDLIVVTGRPVADLMGAVRESLDAGLLGEYDEGAQLGFRHEIVRQDLYQDLPAGLREELHRQAAHDLTAAGAPAAVVGTQLLRARLSAHDVTWAGEAAARASEEEPAVAAPLWGRIREILDPDDPRRDQAGCGQAGALLAVGRLAEAEEVALDVLATAGERRVPDAVRCRVSAVLASGDYPRARTLAEEASRSRLLHRHERAEHTAWAILAQVLAGDRRTASTLLDDSATEGDLSAVAVVTRRLARGLLDAAEGRWDAARADLDPASLPAGSPGTRDPSVLALAVARATVLADADRLAEAASLVDQALGEGAPLSGPVPVRRAFVRAQVRVALDRGDLLTAAEVVPETVRADEVNEPFRRVQLAMRAVIALHLEGPTAAQRWLGVLTEARPVARGLAGAVWPARAEALVCFAGEDGEGALAALAAGWDECDDGGWAADRLLLGTELAAAASALGDRALAVRAADGLAALANQNPGVVTLSAASLTARGFADDDPELLLRGLRTWRLSPRALQAAWVTEHAAVRLEGRRADEAAELAQWAAATYARIGARHDALRLRAALRKQGVRVRTAPHPRPTRGWESLTPTEQVVAEQMEQGLTNAEIADQMVLSRRTVESHVSRILAKLGLRSRTELVIAAAQSGRGHPTEDEPRT